jgi:hypothetical protein
MAGGPLARPLGLRKTNLQTNFAKDFPIQVLSAWRDCHHPGLAECPWAVRGPAVRVTAVRMTAVRVTAVRARAVRERVVRCLPLAMPVSGFAGMGEVAIAHAAFSERARASEASPQTRDCKTQDARLEYPT